MGSFSEPRFVYKRAAKRFAIKEVAILLDGMARNTVDTFFETKLRDSQVL